MKKVHPHQTIKAPEAIAKPIKIPEGYLLKDPNEDISWLSTGWGVVGLLLWCSFFVPMFVFFLWHFISAPMLNDVIALLMLSLLMAFGLLSLVEAVKRIYRVFWMKAGELILPTYPLCQGETYLVQYRRAMRRGRTKAPTKILASWVNYTWAKSNDPMDTVPTIRELDRIELFDKTVMAGVEQIEYEAQITISEHMFVSSHEDSRNQRRWALQITTQIPSLPLGTSHFVVEVLSV